MKTGSGWHPATPTTASIRSHLPMRQWHRLSTCPCRSRPPTPHHHKWGRLFGPLHLLGLHLLASLDGSEQLINGLANECGAAPLANDLVHPVQGCCRQTGVDADHVEGWPAHCSLLVWSGNYSIWR